MRRKAFKHMWAVSTGVYSDYRVCAVFEKQDDAENWAQAIGDEARVEQIMHVPAGVRPFKQTVYGQSANLWDNGEVVLQDVWSHTDYPIDSLFGEVPTRPKVRYVRAPIHRNKGGRVDIAGPTAASVAKVMNERIMAWKAGAWAGPECREINE